MDQQPEAEGREPLFNAPLPSLVLVAVILGSYAWETIGGGDAVISALAFAPAQLDQGRWLGVLTVMFVHGSWAHAIMNGLGALAFGPPVARAMGPGLKGVALFFAFYLVCGVISTLAYAAMHLHDPEQVVGASGAISGLMGAASRMLGPRWAGLSPILSRPVISIGLGWILVNAILATTGAAPFMAGARIAWEAHIAGFVCGVLLVGPFVRFAMSDPGIPMDRADLT
jgi:membrane associated rhomboid family serine protease